MVVSELIQLLKEQPPDIKVVVRGYENGYNDISLIKPLNLFVPNESKWYDGKYLDDDKATAIKAIELFGENNIEVEKMRNNE